MLNYSADLILVSWMFNRQPIFLDVLFCISSALIGISITALYLKRPSLMLPDILYKVVVLACSLFSAILDADNRAPGASVRLLMVAIALLTHIYENYFLFNAISAFYREQEGVENRRPPPSYNLFANSFSKSTDFQTKTVVQNSENDAENGESSASGTTGRCSPPPPSYEIAVKKLKELHDKRNGNMEDFV